MLCPIQVTQLVVSIASNQLDNQTKASQSYEIGQFKQLRFTNAEVALIDKLQLTGGKLACSN